MLFRERVGTYLNINIYNFQVGNENGSAGNQITNAYDDGLHDTSIYIKELFKEKLSTKLYD